MYPAESNASNFKFPPYLPLYPPCSLLARARATMVVSFVFDVSHAQYIDVVFIDRRYVDYVCAVPAVEDKRAKADA